MADRQIDELSFASDISDATTFAANNNASTYEAQQVSVGQIATFMGARADAVHNLGDLHYNKSNLAIDNPGAVPGWTGEYVTNANNVYPDLYTWLKTSHPELCVTRAKYDSDIIATDECKYFVIDEVSGSIRFPKYKYVAPDYPWIYVFNAAVPQSTTQGAAYTEALVSKASIDLSNLNEAGENRLGANVRCIGELVPSTLPLTSAGLHLLDGSVLQGSGSYANFVTYIKRLYTENPTANYFTTEENWQSSYSTYGSCGKFVYDSANNTVRLPKISDIIQGTTDVGALGNLVEAGLPNITGTATIGGTGSWPIYIQQISGALYTTQSTNYMTRGENTGPGPTGLGFNASRSNPTYGKSNTVQPQTIKVLYYIVVSNVAKTEIQVDIDNVMTDVNNKVDKSDLQEVKAVVEAYHNGTSWYRLYNDGWIEQGGMVTIASHQYGYTDVTLLRTMGEINYNITIGGVNSTENGNYVFTVGNINNITTSSFRIWDERSTGSNHENRCYWKVCGYADV